VGDLLEQFASVEEKFQQAGATEQEMIDALRKSYANNHQVGGTARRGAGAVHVHVCLWVFEWGRE
jgi:hypothetical protein